MQFRVHPNPAQFQEMTKVPPEGATVSVLLDNEDERVVGRVAFGIIGTYSGGFFVEGTSRNLMLLQSLGFKGNPLLKYLGAGEYQVVAPLS